MCGAAEKYQRLTPFFQGWIVGMLEGEGSFYARRRSDRLSEFWIEVCSNDSQTPERLQELLGGKIYGPYGDRTYTKWRLHRRSDVLSILPLIRDSLCPRRREQIDYMLTVYNESR